MNPKVITGARAKVTVGRGTQSKVIGVMNNVSFNVTYDTQDAFILGRLTAAEIGYTAVEPVNGSMGFWRVLDHGAYAELGLPKIQDLLQSEYTTISVEDRLTGKSIGTIQSVRLLGTSSGTTARQMAEGSIQFKGLMFTDETATDNAENTNSTDLP